MGQGFAEISSTDVQHAQEDPQTEVARMLIDCLPSGRNRLLELTAPGMFDRLSAKSRNIVHARTYSRCLTGCIDEHGLVATPCRDG